MTQRVDLEILPPLRLELAIHREHEILHRRRVRAVHDEADPVALSRLSIGRPHEVARVRRRPRGVGERRVRPEARLQSMRGDVVAHPREAAEKFPVRVEPVRRHPDREALKSVIDLQVLVSERRQPLRNRIDRRVDVRLGDPVTVCEPGAPARGRAIPRRIRPRLIVREAAVLLVVSRTESQRHLTAGGLDGECRGVAARDRRHLRGRWEVQAQQPVAAARVHAAVEPVVAGPDAVPHDRHAVLSRVGVHRECIPGSVDRAAQDHAAGARSPADDLRDLPAGRVDQRP